MKGTCTYQHPGMIQNLDSTAAILRIFLQHKHNEILAHSTSL